jgi:hypothetical protein
MLKLAASLLSLALVAPAASARSFAQPPTLRPRQGEVFAAKRAELRAALARRRVHNLAAFRAYVAAGIYPHNYKRTGPLNVWLDPQGHLCAAATMIDRDGHHDLVMATARDNNYLRLLDVTDGPLLDWMLTSGFTLEEIDRIQVPGFRGSYTVEPGWQVAEDARLRKAYAATDKYLVAHERDGLDTAVDRLMERPDLAKALLEAPTS